MDKIVELIASWKDRRDRYYKNLGNSYLSGKADSLDDCIEDLETIIECEKEIKK